MSEKKELNQEQLKTVTGGTQNQDPYYYVIEYTDNAGYNGNYHDGPFESLEIAQAKLEEKKKEIIERGFVIKDTHIVCPHI